MTHRERILTLLRGEIPDRVPCSPDISNMVPCRMTGKPFWDIYLYHDPPLWKAYLDAVKYFDFDGGFELYDFGEVDPLDNTEKPWEERIVMDDRPTSGGALEGREAKGRIVTQKFNRETGAWDRFVTVYTASNPPGTFVRPQNLGLPAVPTEWEPVRRRVEWPKGRELWLLIREQLGDHGVLALHSGITTKLLETEEDIFSYYDNPSVWHEEAERRTAVMEERMKIVAEMDPKPDFLMCGSSGTLVTQSPEIVRSLTLPMLKRATELAAEIGIPTHVHSCGPETELVKMAAEETHLTIIDPLEVPPMGDCNLAELKRRYGDKIILKGNLHTTEVMLKGTPAEVEAASKKAIDDAAAGGGFVLSTGDQCGRDTPEENLRAMIETAYTYGKY